MNQTVVLIFPVSDCKLKQKNKRSESCNLTLTNKLKGNGKNTEERILRQNSYCHKRGNKV